MTIYRTSCPKCGGNRLNGRCRDCPRIRLLRPKDITQVPRGDNQTPLISFDCPKCDQRTMTTKEPTSKGVFYDNCHACKQPLTMRLTEYEPNPIPSPTDAEKMLKDHPTATPPGWR